MTQPVPVIPPEYSDVAAALAGQYSLERELGRGGMGIVFLARDLRLDRPVAIKMLLPHIVNDENVRERFLREARTAASFTHPNVVPIHRADEIASRVFFVMGYVDGESLAAHVRDRGPLPAEEVAGYMEDVAGALHAAHMRGIVHRDVKAENILIERSSGRALVTDFGIARIAEASPLTATGMVLGTVHYMSPEHIVGDKTDGRSDLYSLGVAAYYALSGRFPFEHETASAIVVAHVTKTAKPLREVAPRVPEYLAQIVDRCLAKDPAGRFASGETLLRALQGVESDSAEWFEEEPVEIPEQNSVVPPVLSETQAQAVWDRAARMQAELDPGEARPPSSTPGSEGSGYRADVVRESGREAGIGTSYVDRALADAALATRGAGSSSLAKSIPAGAINALDAEASPWAGETKLLQFEAKLDGELPERDFDTVIEAARRALGDVGTVGGIGRSMSWSSSDPQRKVQVSVQARDGRTVMMVSERLSPMAGAVFGGIVGGGGGGLGGPMIGVMMGWTHEPLFAFPAALATVGMAYGIARTVYARVTRKRRRQLKELTEKIASDVREVIERRSAAAGRLRSHTRPRLPR